MASCHRCDDGLPEDAEFCPGCGTEVLTADAHGVPVSASREVHRRATLRHLSAFAGAIFPFLLGTGESTESKGGKRTLAEFDLSSEPGNERRVVAEVSEADTDLGLQDRQLERLKTAVAEATMNAMEHGNGYLPVSVKLVASSRMLSVYITDRGDD